jgi:transcriptional regulator of acetoin/glycerol metabolism
VESAARALGLSRATLYRRLKLAREGGLTLGDR